MTTLFEVAVQFFQENDWNFMEIVPEKVLKMGISGNSGEFTCYAIADEELQIFTFVTHCPIKVPDNQRLPVAEFLTRANYGIKVGHFEMDFEDGQIGYKTSIFVKGDRLTAALVENLVDINVFTIDDYFPGIMQVMYGGVSPEIAIKAVEEEE